MDRKKFEILAWCVAVFFALAGEANSLFIDEANTLEVIGKADTRASIRLDDSGGFTNPEVKIGDLVQHRNLLVVDINHDLKKLTKDLVLLYPIRILGLKAKYHILGRFLYEGVYDYGPEIFQDVRDGDKKNIDEFKQSYDLWECYLDLWRGPLFIRFGRQNLAWGETDVFRLLDYINPLDNTFGGPFEDLDDRRIPLWMVRGNYNFRKVGPVSSVSLEGFWVPGFWDARVAPWAPDGTPYEVPLAPDVVKFLRITTPDRKMDNSRWGVRVSGILADNLTFSFAHYKTFLDLPSLRSVVTPNLPLLLNLGDLALEGSFPDVQITGASMNYCEPITATVFRGEVAWFWNEPVFMPEENMATLFGPVFPLPPDVMDLASDLFGVDLKGFGLTGLPLQPQSGRIPEKNILRYMLGFDRSTWIRFLNPIATFFISFQYFGQWVPDYDDRMRQPLELYPDIVKFANVKETEHVFTAVANTQYRTGSLVPQLALAYDVRGTWLIQPQLTLIRGPFRFRVQYSAIEGNFTNFGAFRDRDQISLSVTYILQ